MAKFNLIIICFLIITMFIGPTLLTDGLTRADAVPSILEVTVSPGADPDPRNETSIAVSPRDDRVIVGASKVIQGGGTSGRGETLVATYFSSDGGHSWGTSGIGLETPQKTWGRASDPSVAADLDGNFYLCMLVRDNANFDSGVYILKSTDDGRTFKDPTPVVFDIGNLSAPKQADKCYITVDVSPASPFKNSIYVAWVSTEPDRTVILTSHRAPGAASFSDPKTISHQGDMRGPSIATGPNGEFYAAWEGIGNPRVILFNASTDGGETFLPAEAAPGRDFLMHGFVGSLSDPNAAHRINGVFRMNSFPVIGVDRSSGPNRGMIYVAWAEVRNGRDADIFIKKLTPPNGGRPIVSSPIRVNSDIGAGDQFFPWLDVDSSTGAVEVAFYDQRDDAGGLLVNLYLARSTDGGESFFENTRVSSAPSDPRIQANVLGSNNNLIGIGDYIGTVAARGKAHVMWTDTRGGKQEIRYGQLDFGSTPPPPGGLPADNCQSPRVIATLPYLDTVDTSLATSSSDDPVSCTGGQDTNTVWYTIVPTANTVYGVDTSLSDYDTVVSVHSGDCGSLARVTCSDDFGNPPARANRSVLTFPAIVGVPYLIVASGKGSGGSLSIRVGYPTITGVEYTTAPDGSNVLKITGAGFITADAAVTAQLDGEEIALPKILSFGSPLPDGTDTILYAAKKKLKKLIKRGSLLVRVESPAGSGRVSNTFLFTRR